MVIYIFWHVIHSLHFTVTINELIAKIYINQFGVPDQLFKLKPIFFLKDYYFAFIFGNTD